MIQYISDLHLEFEENSQYVKNNPIQPVGEVLLLGGDIIPFIKMDECRWFFEDVSAKFKLVLWIPGNHEFYGWDINEAETSYMLNPVQGIGNIFIVKNAVQDYGGYRIIMSTLWSNISPASEGVIFSRLNDFYRIKYNGGQFLPEHYNELHRQCVEFLKEEIARPFEGKKIVLTHHVPTYLNYPKRYKGDVLNEAFHTELYNLIYGSDLYAWIYGHHHANIPEFKIDNTLMLTNQLGYMEGSVKNIIIQ